MDVLNKDILRTITDFQSINCVSLYIPTHRYGKEVNEGEDARLLKNHYQQIKNHLEEKGLQEQEIIKYLAPVQQLIDDGNFWRQQRQGLAIFLGDNFFEYYKLPYPVQEFYLVSTSFHLEQLLSLFTQQDMFYVLALSLKKVRLFATHHYDIQELDVKDVVPENINVVLSYYEFEQEQQSPGQWQGGGNSPTYPNEKKDKGFDKVYMEEYFRQINDGLQQSMINKELPVVLAAVEYLHPIYKKTNKHLNLYEQGIKSNPDELRPDELLDKAIELIRPHLDKKKFEKMEAYRTIAGTGKAAYDIKDIAPEALDGRIDTLFVVHGTHHWGVINPENHTVELHDEKHENDHCLVSKSAVQTILHGGDVYFVDKESLPEDLEHADMAAIFRW